MKISKKYVLFINSITKHAFFGTEKFDLRISKVKFGQIYDCNFLQLKKNLKYLEENGYTISKKKW